MCILLVPISYTHTHTYVRTYTHTCTHTFISYLHTNTHTHARTHTGDIKEIVWSRASEISTRELRKFFDNMRVVRGIFTPALTRGALHCMIQAVRVDSMGKCRYTL